MAGRPRRRRLTIRTKIASQPIPEADWQAAERLLAHLVAQAWAADHPHLFQPPTASKSDPAHSDPDAGDEP